MQNQNHVNIGKKLRDFDLDKKISVIFEHFQENTKYHLQMWTNDFVRYFSRYRNKEDKRFEKQQKYSQKSLLNKLQNKIRSKHTSLSFSRSKKEIEYTKIREIASHYVFF